MKAKHLISIQDLDRSEIIEIFTTTQELKARRQRGEVFVPLAGKTLAMIFQKSSTRTRVSFEAGMLQLGGHALFLSASDLQLNRGETIADTARTLSRYVDGIMIRTFKHQDVIDLAAYGSIPVINGLTDLLHPCQILADIYTIIEHKRRQPADPQLEDVRVTFVGDGNNVCNSLAVGCSKLGMHFTVCPPQGYDPDATVWGWAEANCRQSGGTLRIERDPAKAVAGADVIYTDVWASMGQETERAERLKVFRPYQVNADLLRHAKPDVLVMHCLPAHRGEEITDEVVDGPHSIVFDEAENRLHVQKAVLFLLLGRS
ncbi:MAG TPA: ornithine carbamoyltransferase [bacterium]|nr:ornithine carbamoyltransferase [bacterium]